MIDHSLSVINSPDKDGETPAYKAAALNSVTSLDMLVRHGANVTLANHSGLRPVHIAAALGYTEVLKYLLTAKNVGHGPLELVSLVDNNEETALFHAVRGGYEDAVELLVQKGASVSHQSADLSTPLHLACSAGLKKIVRVLVEKAMPQDLAKTLIMVDDQGMTPLHRSVPVISDSYSLDTDLCAVLTG